mmetsp:Transcript_10073/g.18327  ORF Transcript_10073/g.18327 Transcript_10073/m.18327 type:complete len:598 (-) Transcript_10073:155-1948(-)|eukprot:CAMPEP_0197524414 /NCGR_PEP_ID=MMETSP1318-20131121/9101_1 /TAXON_ID=552666 /ORGANISM="Partenskyella glossopodia, Strain RCC365" /LENGTH=597 /DNA_ID=CAMNT_0043077367 /DNA_START=195 /DNA_END=1988 /DNA_ORIENTATION=+
MKNIRETRLPVSSSETEEAGLFQPDLKRPSSQHHSGIDLNPSDFDPTLLSEIGINEEEDCCADDGGFERCCTHCWFLLTCMVCYIYASLLRLVVVADFVITLIFFVHRVTHEGNFVQTEITHYDFSNSVIFVLVLSFIRNLMLFICYAYKYQTYYSTFVTATILTALSAVFLSIKLMFCVPATSALPITLSSLVTCLTSYFLYGCVRRRRISVPPRRKKGGGVGGRDGSVSALKNYDYEKLADARFSDVETGSVAAPLSARERFQSIPDGVPPKSLADPFSRFVDFDGISVHYRYSDNQSKRRDQQHERGGAAKQNKNTSDSNSSESRPTLILLHGFGGSVFSWNKIWHELASNDEVGNVLAFDRPGFGLTSRPTAEDWEHNPYTQQFSLMLLFKLMDFLGIQKASFVGHGSGGALAVLAAAMRPNRVHMLGLVSPAIYTSGFPTFLRSLFRTRLGKSIVTDLVRSEMGELLLRRSYHDKKRLTADVLQTYKNLLKVHNWDSALLEMTRVQPKVKVETKVALVQCPLAIIHGGKDKLISINESKRLMKALERHGQHGELFAIESCGHVPHEEIPEDFTEVLLKSLRFGSEVSIKSDE